MIWIVQLLCPARHCILAVAYDPEKTTKEESTEMLAGAVKMFNPWCGICGSTDLKYEAAPTKFRTMQEAEFPLALAEAAQRLTAEEMAKRPKPN